MCGVFDRHFPASILHGVFEQVSTADLLTCRLVCKEWLLLAEVLVRELAPTVSDSLSILVKFKHVKHLDLSQVRSNSPALLSCLEKFKELCSVVLPKDAELADQLMAAAFLSRKQVTQVKCDSASLSLVTSLALFPQLTVLDITLPGGMGFVMQSLTSLPNLSCLRLINYQRSHSQDWHHLGQLQWLRELHLELYKLDDEAFFAFEKLPRLEQLSLPNMSGRNVTAAGTEALGRMTSLKSLRLCAATMGAATASVSDALTRLVRLEHLDLDGCDMTKPDVVDAALTLTSLTNLNLMAMADGQTANCSRLANLTNLEHLDLSWNELNEEWIEAASLLPRLHTLRLAWCRTLTDEVLENLTRLTTLRVINMYQCGSATRARMLFLSALPQLTTLQLYRGKLSGQDWSLLGMLTNLEVLCLRACIYDHPEEFLGGIHVLQRLTGLDLCSTPVQPQHLHQLTALPQLHQLDLSCLHCVSDELLEAVGKLRGLRYLDLSRVGVLSAGNDSLARLAEMSSLRKLKCNHPRVVHMHALRYVLTHHLPPLVTPHR